MLNVSFVVDLNEILCSFFFGRESVVMLLVFILMIWIVFSVRFVIWVWLGD